MSMDFPIFPQYPGGGIAASHKALNALTESELDNTIKQIEAKYKPLTLLSKSLSEIAYAKLVGPQFVAKMLQNPDIVANMKNPQELVNYLAKTGSQQFNNNNLNKNNIALPFNEQPFPRYNISNQSDNNSNENKINQPPFINPKNNQSMNNMQSNDYMQNNNENVPSVPLDRSNVSYAEKAGFHKGLIREGEESGKIRADIINDLNKDVFNGQTLLTSTDKAAKIITNPVFMNMRKIPFAGQHEIGYYLENGTKEEKYIAGEYVSTLGNLVRDFVKTFGGRALAKEIDLANTAKASEKDMPEVAAGKIASMEYLIRMVTERSRLTSEYMSKYHINELEAQTIADKQVNGEKIRNETYNKLNPKPTERDREFMKKYYKIDDKELDRRLKAKGIL